MDVLTGIPTGRGWTSISMLLGLPSSLMQTVFHGVSYEVVHVFCSMLLPSDAFTLSGH